MAGVHYLGDVASQGTVLYFRKMDSGSGFAELLTKTKTRERRKVTTIWGRLLGREEVEKDDRWAALCRAGGWTCINCGAIPPEPGVRFADDICGQCQQLLDTE